MYARDNSAADVFVSKVHLECVESVLNHARLLDLRERKLVIFFFS